MKLGKLVPIMLFVLLLALVSCQPTPEKLIVNTWKVTDVSSEKYANDSTFIDLRENLLKVELTFKDNKYSMILNGNAIESGTYAVDGDKLVVITEKGVSMIATVTKDKLTLATSDFVTTLQPK